MPNPSRPTRILAVALFLLAVIVLSAVVGERIEHPAVDSVPDGQTLILDLGHGVMLELVRVPAGQFFMGSPASEIGRDASEGPRHSVQFARDFFIGRDEITQAQWVAVMGNNQSQFRGEARLPAECVSWGDCQKFCQEVSKRTGRRVRLPSEAEWEYACRAGAQTVFCFGDSLSSRQANFNGKAPYGGAPTGPAYGKTKIVGSYVPNAWGLYDTHGNVWEWCQDVFHDSYTGAPADGSAWMGGGDPDIHIYRGGACDNDGVNCRSAIRYAAEQDLRSSAIGFRVVVESGGG